MPPLKVIASDKPHGIRAVGIAIHEGRVLLMRREQGQRRYFTFPGGGVEEGETVEEAVVRELLEETGLTVSVTRLLYHHDLIGDSDQFYYECASNGGKPVLGGEELEETRQGDIHEPLWMPLTELPNITLYPLEVRDWLIEDIENGFPSRPRELRVRRAQRRQ